MSSTVDLWNAVKDREVFIPLGEAAATVAARAAADVGRYNECLMIGSEGFLVNGQAAEKAGIRILQEAGLCTVQPLDVVRSGKLPQEDALLNDGTKVLIKMISLTNGKINWNVSQYKRTLNKVPSSSLVVAVSLIKTATGRIAKVAAISSLGFIDRARRKLDMRPCLPPPTRVATQTYWQFDIGCFETPTPFEMLR